MGLPYVHARLRKIDGRGPGRDVRFFVDSGLIYSVLPEKIWWALRLKPEREVEFTLADGTSIKRSVSECRFEIAVRQRHRRLFWGKNMMAPCSAR